MTALEPASFEVERFALDGNSCLEVRGRWFGVRGRRFMRPTLTAVADGREQRMLAVLDHKPWVAEEGETWLAAFPCPSDPTALAQAELTVAPDVTVPLPPLSRARTRRQPKRPATPDPAGDRDAPEEQPTAAGGESEQQRRLEEALRARDEALAELDEVKRSCRRLRTEREQALATRDAAVAERHEAIETEVRLRIADLQAETDRERAGARLAAQTTRERDAARAERDEAAHERDQAYGERDAARQERNRMLAERDTARGRVEETTRQWELTAALGTQRTLERDAVAVERDRLDRDLHAAVKERDAVALERERLARDLATALEERDAVTVVRNRLAHDLNSSQAERDAVSIERDRLSGTRDALTVERDRLAGARDALSTELDELAALRPPAPGGHDGPAGDGDAGPEPADPAEEESTLVLDAVSEPDEATDEESALVIGDRDAPSREEGPAQDRPTLVLGEAEARLLDLEARQVDRDEERRLPPAPSEPRHVRTAAGGPVAHGAPIAHGARRYDPAAMWRARLLAISALLIFVVILLVMLLTK